MRALLAAGSLGKEHSCRAQIGVNDWCYFSSYKSSAALLSLLHRLTGTANITTAHSAGTSLHSNHQCTHSTHTRLSPIPETLSYALQLCSFPRLIAPCSFGPSPLIFPTKGKIILFNYNYIIFCFSVSGQASSNRGSQLWWNCFLSFGRAILDRFPEASFCCHVHRFSSLDGQRKFRWLIYSSPPCFHRCCVLPFAKLYTYSAESCMLM